MPEVTETTNAVLAEQIQGLAKLTDEKLQNIKDSLSRIELSAVHFARKSELEEIKNDFTNTINEIKNLFEQHNADDKEAFAALKKGSEETRGTIKYATGAISIIFIVLQFIIPIILNNLKLI